MKELHVKSLLPVRLDKYLMDQFPALGMGRLNKALRENKIKLNGKKLPLSTRVQNGDIIKLFLNDDQLENRPTPAAVFVCPAAGMDRSLWSGMTGRTTGVSRLWCFTIRNMTGV